MHRRRFAFRPAVLSLRAQCLRTVLGLSQEVELFAVSFRLMIELVKHHGDQHGNTINPLSIRRVGELTATEGNAQEKHPRCYETLYPGKQCMNTNQEESQEGLNKGHPYRVERMDTTAT